jgi:hypothetical protein
MTFSRRSFEEIRKFSMRVSCSKSRPCACFSLHTEIPEIGYVSTPNGSQHCHKYAARVCGYGPLVIFVLSDRDSLFSVYSLSVDVILGMNWLTLSQFNFEYSYINSDHAYKNLVCKSKRCSSRCSYL